MIDNWLSDDGCKVRSILHPISVKGERDKAGVLYYGLSAERPHDWFVEWDTYTVPGNPFSRHVMEAVVPYIALCIQRDCAREWLAGQRSLIPGAFYGWDSAAPVLWRWQELYEDYDVALIVAILAVKKEE